MKFSIECPLGHRIALLAVVMEAEVPLKLSARGLDDIDASGGHVHADPVRFTCPVGGESYRIDPTIERIE